MITAEAFEFAQAALLQCPDRASIRRILDVLKSRIEANAQPASDHKVGDTAIDIVMSVDRALQDFSPAEVLDENSPIRGSIRDLVRVAGRRLT